MWHLNLFSRTRVKILSGMTNSVDPDQTAPLGAVWSGTALFAYGILSETLANEILRLLPYNTSLLQRDKKCIFIGPYKQSIQKKVFYWVHLWPTRHKYQGPVVQSIVSLTSSLRVISLTVLADSIYNNLIFFAEKMWVAFALQKLLIFFSAKISAYLRMTRFKL